MSQWTTNPLGKRLNDEFRGREERTVAGKIRAGKIGVKRKCRAEREDNCRRISRVVCLPRLMYNWLGDCGDHG